MDKAFRGKLFLSDKHLEAARSIPKISESNKEYLQ